MAHAVLSRARAARSLLVLFLALTPAAARAQEPAAQDGGAHASVGSRIAPIAAIAGEAPRIDGRLDDAAWRAAPVLADWVQREPVEGSPVSERTEVRLLYDGEAVYVGAWLYDREPDGIVYGETRRDADLKDSDAFQIVLDTFLDRQNGFVFGTTPAGIQFDGQISREGEGGGGMRQRQQAGAGGGFNKNWDGSWDVATTRDAAGWYAEFRIPFSTLRYAQGGAQRWGLNLARQIRRRNEQAVWSPVPRQFDLYRLSLAGVLEGFEAPPQRVLTVSPYVLASTRRDYAVSASFGSDAELGGDAKIGLTPGLTLDLTVNTDFAQVEVDEEQVNLTRFRLFFPEKRPFFLENAGTFAVGSPQEVELFFSRRIGLSAGRVVPIVAGGRVTGKVAGLTVGLLDIQTERLEVPRSPVEDPPGSAAQTELLAPANNFAVTRALKELGQRSRFGAIVASRVNTDDADDYNLTYGLDGRLGLGEAVTFEGYAAGTRTPGIDDASHAYSLSGSYTAADWRFSGSFREVADGFDPQVGFLARGGHRAASARILRAYRFPELSWFRELRPHISYREYWDLDGFSESGFWHFDSHFEFANGAFFQLPALNYNTEGLKEPFEIAPGVVIPPGTYEGWEWGFAYNTDRSAPLSIEGSIDIGSFYSGHRAGTSSTLNFRWGDRFAGGLRGTYYDVELPEGSFTTSLLGLRAAYSFTPSIYLQSLVQYNDQTRTFSSNIRFGWLGTAGTGLFVVYNDVEETALFERGVPRRPLERSLIVKFTRLFDLGR